MLLPAQSWLIVASYILVNFVVAYLVTCVCIHQNACAYQNIRILFQEIITQIISDVFSHLVEQIVKRFFFLFFFSLNVDITYSQSWVVFLHDPGSQLADCLVKFMKVSRNDSKLIGAARNYTVSRAQDLPPSVFSISLMMKANVTNNTWNSVLGIVCRMEPCFREGNPDEQQCC